MSITPHKPTLPAVDTTKPAKQMRGFASMDPQRQREIASQGGITAHENGTAHQFTSEEAREAGKKSWKNRKDRKVVKP